MSNRLAVGNEVYSADGAMLGHVGQVGRDAFLVHKGFWFLKDSVLPRSTIARVESKRVLLGIDRDEARHVARTPYDFEEEARMAAEERGFPAPSGHGIMRESPPMRQTVNVIRNNTPAPVLTDDATRAELRAGEHLTVPVVEEELQVQIRDVDAGRVRIVKTAVDEQATMQVPVRHEEVYVRQRPVYRAATTDDLARSERVVEIPLHAQEVVTMKAAMVTGEVDVHKEVTEETEWVTDTVRHDEVHVEEGNNDHVHYAGTGQRGRRRAVRPGDARREDAFVLEEAPPVARQERSRATR